MVRVQRLVSADGVGLTWGPVEGGERGSRDLECLCTSKYYCVSDSVSCASLRSSVWKKVLAGRNSLVCHTS